MLAIFFCFLPFLIRIQRKHTQKIQNEKEEEEEKIKSRNLLRSFAVCSAYRQITMVIEQFATLKTKEIENSSKHTASVKARRAKAARIKRQKQQQHFSERRLNENERKITKDCNAKYQSDSNAATTETNTHCRHGGNSTQKRVDFLILFYFYYFASFVFFIAHREHALSAAAAYELWLKKTVHTPRAKCIIDEQKKKNKRKNNTKIK